MRISGTPEELVSVGEGEQVVGELEVCPGRKVGRNLIKQFNAGKVSMF